MALVLGACSPDESAVRAEDDGAEAARTELPVTDLASEPVPDARDPSTRAGAAADFVDCEYGVWQGGWVGDFGPIGSGPTADAAVLAMADSALIAAPPSGFAPAARDTGRIAYTYVVDGRSRFAAVVADTAETGIDVPSEDRWVVEVFASCDPAEFAPDADAHIGYEIWVDDAGERVPTSTLTMYRGPAHCGWETVTFLAVEGTTFASDPADALGELIDVPFAPDTDLPLGAEPTGYHHARGELFLDPDATVAYIVTGDGTVEGWPALTSPAVCA